MLHLMDKDSLEFALLSICKKKSDFIQYKHLRCINITKYSKAWWNKDYQVQLATISFLFCLNSLDLLLNMEKLKSLIFSDHMEYSILLLSTSVVLKVLLFSPKILGIILGLFLIESFFLTIYQILFKQSFVNCQVHKNAWELPPIMLLQKNTIFVTFQTKTLVAYAEAI